MKVISIKDLPFFLVFALPISFYAILTKWSIAEGILDVLFSVILYIVIPAFLFTFPFLIFVIIHRTSRAKGQVKSNMPFIISYIVIAVLDISASAMGAFETATGAPGSALNAVSLYYLPFVNILIIILLYPACRALEKE